MRTICLSLLVIGTAVSYLGLTWLAARTGRKTAGPGAPLSGLALAFLVAVRLGRPMIERLRRAGVGEHAALSDSAEVAKMYAKGS